MLRNLLHCSTTYLPFGQRQQSSQITLSKVELIKGKWYQMEVNYSPVGSMPLIPLQIAKSSVIDFIAEGEPIINSELGLSLASTFSATRFESQIIVDEDNSNIAMVTFWVPRDANFSFLVITPSLTMRGKRSLLRLSIVVVYYRKLVLRENHLGMRRKVNTGEKSENISTLATRTNLRLLHLLASTTRLKRDALGFLKSHTWIT